MCTVYQILLELIKSNRMGFARHAARMRCMGKEQFLEFFFKKLYV